MTRSTIARWRSRQPCRSGSRFGSTASSRPGHGPGDTEGRALLTGRAKPVTDKVGKLGGRRAGAQLQAPCRELGIGSLDAVAVDFEKVGIATSPRRLLLSMNVCISAMPCANTSTWPWSSSSWTPARSARARQRGPRRRRLLRVLHGRARRAAADNDPELRAASSMAPFASALTTGPIVALMARRTWRSFAVSHCPDPPSRRLAWAGQRRVSRARSVCAMAPAP